MSDILVPAVPLRTINGTGDLAIPDIHIIFWLNFRVNFPFGICILS